MKPKTYVADCPTCPKHSKSRFHEIDQKTFEVFGYDCLCMRCIRDEHLRFMRTTGKKLGLTCAPGCECGR